ncbi:MAG: APC family permease, partial [Thermomicrobiaceae bacterium]|nr:APC family permease [Thermomicrobiaceae bacterium]
MANGTADGGGEDSKPLREAQMVRGTRPGNRYVRIVQADDLPPAPRPEYVVAPPTVPESVLGRAVHSVERLLFGPPLATAQEVHERLTKVKALAVLSSDALSSVAYATEEMMRILILAGIAALAWTLPLTLAVLVVLVTVVISYQQTIQAYPHGGGSYTVASDNLGQLPGLVAAAALLTDYVLTVAVSIAAGVLAITSAFPALDP